VRWQSERDGWARSRSGTWGAPTSDWVRGADWWPRTTLTADGTLVRRASDVASGQQIVTRLAEGSVRSTVDGVDAGPVEVERVDVETDGTNESGVA